MGTSEKDRATNVPDRPAAHPHAAGLTPGWVFHENTPEARLGRLEKVVDKLLRFAEQIAAVAAQIQNVPVGSVLADLDAENRRLRAELAKHAKGNR